jgi:hypothetical protein
MFLIRPVSDVSYAAIRIWDHICLPFDRLRTNGSMVLVDFLSAVFPRSAENRTP